MERYTPVERYRIKYREKFMEGGDDIPFYEDLTVLYNSKYAYEVIPLNNLPKNRFYNAILRMVILLVVGFVVNTYIFSTVSFLVNSVIGAFYLIGLYSGGKLFASKSSHGKGEPPKREEFLDVPQNENLIVKKTPQTLEEEIKEREKGEEIKEREKEEEIREKEGGNLPIKKEETKEEKKTKDDVERQIFEAMVDDFLKNLNTKDEDEYGEMLTSLQDKKDIDFMKKVQKIHEDYGGKDFTELPLSEAFSETINRRLKRFRNQRLEKHHKIPHSAHRDTLLEMTAQRRVIP